MTNRFRAKVGKWFLARCYVPMTNKKGQTMHYHKSGSYQYVYRDKNGLHIGRRYYKAGQPRLRHVKSMAELSKYYEKPISEATESVSLHILNEGPQSSGSNNGFVMKSNESSQPTSSESDIGNDDSVYIPKHSDKWYKQCLVLSKGSYSVMLNDGNDSHFKFVGKDKLAAEKFADNNVPRWLDEDNKDDGDGKF